MSRDEKHFIGFRSRIPRDSPVPASLKDETESFLRSLSGGSGRPIGKRLSAASECACSKRPFHSV